MKKLLLVLVSILFATDPLSAQFRVVGYFANWSTGFPNNITSVDLNKVTHINIAFSNPNGTGTLTGVTNAQAATIVSACHAKGVKVFISIGGAGAPGATYAGLMNNATNINNFVTKIMTFVTTNNLDGVDVDIEGDVLDGSTVTAAQYQNFVTALGTALHAQSKQMSAALATWFATYVTNTAAAQFDWIGLMSYDQCGPWSGPCQHSPLSLAQSDFSYWNTTKAVPASKLVVGVPFYGYGWGIYDVGDEIGYCDIISAHPGAENANQVGSGANVIYYNGLTLMQQKATYALANASGMMIWQITEDCASTDNRSLLKKIDGVIHPLPVTLLDFSGSLVHNTVVLSWNTASEINNDHFSVERSADGILFESIGTVKKNSVDSPVKHYSFIDMNFLHTNYYRLAQYDTDGSVSYSQTIQIDHTVSSDIFIYPNPFEDEIMVNKPLNIPVNCVIRDLQGNTLYEKSFSDEEIIIRIRPILPLGIYFMSVYSEDNVQVFKIVRK
jgi:GH18 family chitinase